MLFLKRLSILAAAFSLTSFAFGASVEAKKDGVDILSSPEKSGTVIKKMKKGESLTAKERKGMYWEVKTKDGKSGFVSVLLVKHKADESGLSNAIRSSVKEGRSSGDVEATRSRSAVMGVRGLDENDTALAGNIRPNLRAVYGMEDMHISKIQLDAFGEELTREIEANQK